MGYIALEGRQASSQSPTPPKQQANDERKGRTAQAGTAFRNWQRAVD